jgi:hypothetical protein
MILTPKIIEKLDHTGAKYGEEPFSYEFSEQDLYENIRHDIRDYENGTILTD